MKRREQDAEQQIPPELLEYDPVDWPAAGRRGWHEARLRYAEANPTGPLGDPLDVLRAEARSRRTGWSDR